jgi:hypothetical protein
MEDTLETRSPSNNVTKLSENNAAPPTTPARGAAIPEHGEETYPPAREVIPILLALASTIFLVSLVSSPSLRILKRSEAELDFFRTE